MKECPECGSEKIVKNAEISTAGSGTARVSFHQNPSAAFFTGSVVSGTRADVCGDCGLIQLFAMDPRKIWDAYQNTRSDVE